MKSLLNNLQSLMSRRAARLVVVLLVGLLLVLLAFRAVAIKSRQSTASGQSAPHESAQGAAALQLLKERGQYASLRQALETAQYRAQARPERPGEFAALNPAQAFHARFTPQGLEVRRRSAEPSPRLALTLRGIGYGARQLPVSPGTVTAQDQRIEIHRTIGDENTSSLIPHPSSLTEWYVNRPSGLEQGFMIAEPPGERRAGEWLRLTLEMSGQWRARLGADGQAVEFSAAAGGGTMRYDHLAVWDAQGQRLPARMRLHGTALRLEVEDAGAHWPLTIDPTISQQAYLKTSSNTGAQDLFGNSVAVSGDTVVIGALWEDSSTAGVNSTPNDNATNAGAAYIFVHNGGVWTQQAYLKASNPEPDYEFGNAVAISGDTVVVASDREDSSTTGVNSTPNGNAGLAGAAYVFVRSGTTWTQQAYLKASNTGSADRFGWSVAISGDTIVVGAKWEDSNGTGVNNAPGNNSAGEAGAAYVFVRSGTTWTQQAYLKASNTGAGDEFGRAVAVAGDTVVVTAVKEDSSTTGVNSTPDDAATDAGAAYVFTRSGTTWTQQAYLKASNTGADDWLGESVAISGDTVVIGAYGEASSTTGVNSTPDDAASDAGAAYVFTRSGTTWTQQAYLKASNTGAGDLFGISVAVSGDTVVIGASREDSNTMGVNSTPDDAATDAGAAYVFTRSGTTWTQQAYLKASNTGAGDIFGHSVAVSGDTVVIGASREDSNTMGVNSTPNDAATDAGAAYVFTGLGNTAPTITAQSGVARQQGAPVSNSQIATVSDAETAAGSLTVTITSANPSNGVTVSNLVNTNGTVTADIVAACGASNASFTLQVSDGVATATATLNVTVTANSAPTLVYSNVSVNGGSSTTNSPTTATDNGSITSYAVQSQGTYTGTISVNSSGVVSLSNPSPAGTHTITIRATDNCNTTTDASFTLTVTCGSTVVTNGDDSGEGSLRQVIADACSGSTITFQSGVTTVTLTSAELLIGKNLTINGGASGVAITRSGGTPFRIFNISSGTVSFSKLTISNGSGVEGGGIYNNGALTLTDCTLSNNTTVGARPLTGGGAGIFNTASGTLTVNRCALINNTATGQNGNGGAGGGGGGGGLGGAVYNNGGSVTITNTTLSGNQALGGAGGSAGGSCCVGSGGAGGGNGGAGGVVIPTSSAPQAGSFGGGGGGGGNGNNGAAGGRFGGGGGGGYGAGFSTSGGGAGFLGGAGSSSSSSFSRNGGGGGGGAAGGALFQNGGTMTVVNATIVNNTVMGGAGGTSPSNGSNGAAGSSRGGGIYNEAGTLTLRNSIVAANSAQQASFADCDNNGAAITTNGYNLFGSGTGNPSGGTQDQTVTPSNVFVTVLSPLAYYGGLSQSHRPLTGSPAIDKGSAVTGVTVDQRNQTRPIDQPGVASASGGNASDIGAVELQICSGTVSITPTSLATIGSGVAYNQTFTASGGTAPYSFNLSSGSLPPGLTFSAAGVLSGTPTTNGTYNFTIQAFDSSDCMATQSYTLEVFCPSITAQPASQFICEGSAATLSVGLDNATGASYQWRKGGVNINGATSSSYTIPSFTAADAGSYDVVVSTAICSPITSNAATLTVATATVTPGSMPLVGGRLNGAQFEAGSAASSGTNTWPSTEPPANAFDGAVAKSLIRVTANAGYVFTMAGCSQAGRVINGLRIYTANDAPERDPASYALYGTNLVLSGNGPFDASLFTLISSGSLALPSGRNTSSLDDANSQLVSFSNTTAYKSFMLVFPTIKNAGATISTQIAEVKFYPEVGPPTLTTTAASVVQGETTSASVGTASSGTTQAPNTLSATVSSDGTNFGASATLNGVTVSNLAVAANGNVTASLAATCAASNAVFTLKITNDQIQSVTAALNVTVTANPAPTLVYSNVSVNGGGSTTNTPTTATDNGSIASYAVQSQGTYTGTISVDASGVVSISNPSPAGTHTITIRATDNCGLTTDASFTLTVNCVTSLTVNDLGDGADASAGNGVCATSGGVCTLRAAIQEANALPACGGIALNFSVTGTINLGSVLPNLTKSMSFNGPGADQLTVRRNTGGNYRVFAVNSSSGLTVLFSGLTMSNGVLTGGSNGGGLIITGTGAHNVTLQNCTVSGNTVDNFGGGLSNQSSASTLNIIGSTISGNVSTGVTSDGSGSGAAIDNVGTLNITNSTISGNAANSGSSNSGGLWNSGGTVTFLNATFSNNSAAGANSAGAIYVYSGTVTLKNSLIAGNTASGAPDLRKTSSGNFSTQGYNLIGDNSSVSALFPAGTPNANNDYVGASGTPLDAKLAPLGNYGGTTNTHALLTGSPALDAGTNTDAPTTDQRGRTRPHNTTTDIGAFEANLSLTVPATTLANGTENVSYSQSLNNPVGGTSPYNFMLISGSLPSGITLSSSGTISGTPTATGTFNFSVLVTDSTGAQGQQSYTLTINVGNTAPTFTPAAAISRQQGSPAGAAVTIGTAADGQTAASSLTVTQIAGGTATGITVTGISNSGGTISAMISAACNATAGTVRFEVSDGSLTGTGDLQVNVTPNSAPMLTYAAASVNAGNATTNSPTTATDNGSIASYAVQAQGTYTGTISVNPSGVVSLSSAAPVGSHTITIRATDNCGTTTDAQFTLTVGNNTPTITAGAALTRQQGSAGAGSTIATVNDTETAAGNLVVTATTVPVGLTITAISNSNGTITANVVAECNATVGANTVVLTVTDSNSGTATANLTVNVTANTAPTLSYNNASVPSGSATTNSTATTSDNGSITGYAVQSQGGYTGTLSVNSSGVVSFSNAAPVGTHTITIRATDNCGATTDVSFTLTVGNNAPSITASAALTRQRGSAGTVSTIATVSDTETAAGSLTVTATSVPTGLTVTGITNTAGTISATVAADCTATIGANTVVLTVTDGNNGTATANLTVNVTANTAPTLSYGDAAVNAGNATTNSPTAATDNGSITGYAVQSQGTYTGTISVNAAGVVSFSNAAPVGSHIITIRATDNCGATTDASFTLTVGNNAPTITAGASLTRQRGSTGSVSTIATVSDSETPVGSLVVTATTVPAGITITGITNTAGTIGATVTADCTATLGNNSVVLTVTDGNSGTATANLTVNVTANTTPTVTYANVSVNASGSVTNSPTAASDNGSITGYAVESQGTYTGTISVDASGVVSISNAAPVGMHTITVRATDNCGATTDATFTLTVGNNPPTITAGAALTRQRGTAGSVSTIATVNDGETLVGSLVLTATTVPTGITVTGITNTAGIISATIAADCTATLGANTVVLTVTDGNSGTATANLTVNVTANTVPSLTYSNVSVAAGAATTNGPTTATDNGSITGYAVQSQGTYTGTIAINSSGVVSFSNAGPVGTHTITIRATDNCGATADAEFTVTVGNNAPTITAGGNFTRQQGSAAGTAVTVATVSDAETATGSLTVTATTVPSGITVASILNTNGTITATLAVNCTATLGNNTVVLTVTDGNGGTNTASFTVNVTANTAPTLTYGNASVLSGASTTNSPTAASDNGNIASYAVQSQGTYIGTISVNSSGVVSFSNAALIGSHTITIRATDNCGATTDATFTLTVGNNAPTITASSALTRQRGTTGSNSTIATVNDTETAVGNLTVTATTVPTGITVTSISNTAGTISATVAADCTATLGNNTVVLTVTDSNNETATASLTVNVTANTAPTLTYAAASVNGGSATTNSPTAATDNGSITGYAVQSQGTYTGIISVNSSGVVSISNAAPVGNHTITIRATDNCGTTTDATFTLTVNNTAPTFTPAAAISRPQGSPAGSAVTVGTINDAQIAAGSLTITQIAGGTATGITLTDITNTNGTITAVISAACTATAGTIRFQVSDGNLTGTGDLQVNITSNTAPTLAYAAGSVTAGGSTTNSPTTATDNGSITSYAVQSQGTYTGTISVTSSGVVSFSDAAPGGSHTITIRATDNCGATTDATFTLTVNCQTITVTSPATGSAPLNMPFSQNFTQTGAIGTATFSLASGALPTGLTLASNGLLSGTPTQAGEFPITVKVTDSNNCTGISATYTIRTNTPPTLTPMNVSRTAGSLVSNSQIATVNDAEDAKNLLVVKVNGGTMATAGGITISNLQVSGAGAVTANIVAACGAVTTDFTLRVMDTQGEYTEANLRVTVNANTPPTLAYPATVAAEPGQTLTVTPINGPTDNGSISTLVVSSISAGFSGAATVAANGVVTINNAGPLGTYTITVEATDNCNEITSTSFTLTVIPFLVKLSDPILCTGDNNTLSVHAEVTNPNAVAANLSFNATLPAALTGVAGSCVSSAGVCTVNNGSVSVTGLVAANQTVLIDYKVLVANGTPLGTNLCIDSTASFNNGPLAMVQACTTLNCPPAPANVRVSDQKAGSLLVFPYYVSNFAERKDTRLTISNVGAQEAYVHLFFIEGTSCNQADLFLCLTPKASFSFKASEYDPEMRGWLLAVAVNNEGLPVQNNALIGNAFVSDGEYVDNYGAESFWAYSNALAAVNNHTATLFLDGSSYDAVPSQFMVELQSPVDAPNQRLVTVGLQGDLTTSQLSGASQVGIGQVVNGNEQPAGSFSNFLSGKCQAFATITTTVPRVPNGMSVIIPSGQVGSMKFNIGAGVGLLMTPRTATWRGIRTLHKTAQTTAALTIPIIPPVC